MGGCSVKRWKQMIVVSCIVVLVLIIFLGKKIEDTHFLGLSQITEKEKREIVNSRKEAESDFCEVLYFNQEKIVKDRNSVYYLPLSMEKEWENGEITGEQEEINICLINKGKRKSKQDYQKDGTILPLLIYDDKYVKEVSLVLTGFPMLSIDFLECPENIAHEAEEFYTEIYCYAPGQERKRKVSTVSSKGLVHKRGATSKAFEKCGLKIKLLDKEGNQKKESLCGLREDDDWILIPMYAEESKLRDKLAIDLWREISAGENEENRGTQMEYVELVLNGVYYGLYGIAEPVDKKQLNLTCEGEKSDLLFSIDTAEGFLLSELEQAGNSNQAGNITVKFPKEMNQEKWNAIRDFLQLVYFEEDEKFLREIDSFVEMDNMADCYLYLNAIYGKDNEIKNMYYCMRLLEDGTYRVSLIPWDMDLSFGVLHDAENKNGLYWKYETKDNQETKECACYLTERLKKLKVESFEKALSKRYQEVCKGILTEEKLFNQIEQLSNQIICSGAFERDRLAWPQGGHSTDYSMMREAIRRRLKYLSDLEG